MKKISEAFSEGFKKSVEKQAQIKPFLAGGAAGAAATEAAPYVYDKVKGLFESDGPSREALVNKIRQMRRMRQNMRSQFRN